MQALYQDFAHRIQLTDAHKASIAQYFQHEEVPKNTLLLRAGEYCRKLWFIEQGLARTYYEYEAAEITSWFYLENQIVSSWHSFYTQRPGTEFIQALEDCSLWSIRFDDYQKLLLEDAAFERYGRQLAEDLLGFIDNYYLWSFLGIA